jgi:metallo-beta-lactamase family protein
MRAFRDLGDIYIVHGEYDKQKVFKRVIKERMGKKARIVERGKSYYL